MLSDSPSPTPSVTEVLPRRFGRYLLFDRIGQGGMAEIFLARSVTELGAARLVVVKQILPALAGDPAFARMLIAEAKVAARLRNGNVVQVYDLGREDGRLFIAMEYVEGFDLHALLRQLSRTKTPLPAEFVIFMVREILGALSYAHRAKGDDGKALGVVHRDVSPSNVLVSFEGEVKLCDFGIARALDATLGQMDLAESAPDHAGSDSNPPSISKIAGKSAYMSPEHARGELIDGRADVFAAGILLWEMCAGRRLYRGSEEEMLAQARAGVTPSLPDRGLPEFAVLEAVVSRALAPAVDDRFSTAAEFQKALDEYAAKARLVASPLRFGAFLTEHFGSEVVVRRRARERAAQALELGPPAVLSPIGAPAAAQSEPRTVGSPFVNIADEVTAALPAARASGAPVPAPASFPASTAKRSGVPVLGLVVAIGALSVLSLAVAWFLGWLG